MEKMTKKYVMNTYNKVIKVGYCELQHLLTFSKQIGYTAGVYGWDADVYQVSLNTVIVTGYRPFGNISLNRELCKKYEEKAIEAKKNIFNCEDLRNTLDELVNDFIKELEE